MNSIQKTVLGIIVIYVLFSNDFLIEKFDKWYFGYKYNETRVAYNIPEIPENWNSKKTLKNFIFWYPKAGIEETYIGKEIKIKFFSIISEKDTYQKIMERTKEKISITKFYELNKIPIIEYRIFNDSVLTSEVQLSIEESLKLINEWNFPAGKQVIK